MRFTWDSHGFKHSFTDSHLRCSLLIFSKASRSTQSTQTPTLQKCLPDIRNHLSFETSTAFRWHNIWRQVLRQQPSIGLSMSSRSCQGRRVYVFYGIVSRVTVDQSCKPFQFKATFIASYCFIHCYSHVQKSTIMYNILLLLLYIAGWGRPTLYSTLYASILEFTAQIRQIRWPSAPKGRRPKRLSCRSKTPSSTFATQTWQKVTTHYKTHLWHRHTMRR